ncbi:unnamed protein product, partial [Notodromas monacha]
GKPVDTMLNAADLNVPDDESSKDDESVHHSVDLSSLDDSRENFHIKPHHHQDEEVASAAGVEGFLEEDTKMIKGSKNGSGPHQETTTAVVEDMLLEEAEVLNEKNESKPNGSKPRPIGDTPLKPHFEGMSNQTVNSAHPPLGGSHQTHQQAHGHPDDYRDDVYDHRDDPQQPHEYPDTDNTHLEAIPSPILLPGSSEDETQYHDDHRHQQQQQKYHHHEDNQNQTHQVSWNETILDDMDEYPSISAGVDASSSSAAASSSFPLPNPNPDEPVREPPEYAEDDDMDDYPTDTRDPPSKNQNPVDDDEKQYHDTNPGHEEPHLIHDADASFVDAVDFDTGMDSIKNSYNSSNDEPASAAAAETTTADSVASSTTEETTEQAEPIEEKSSTNDPETTTTTTPALTSTQANVETTTTNKRWKRPSFQSEDSVDVTPEEEGLDLAHGDEDAKIPEEYYGVIPDKQAGKGEKGGDVDDDAEKAEEDEEEMEEEQEDKVEVGKGRPQSLPGKKDPQQQESKDDDKSFGKSSGIIQPVEVEEEVPELPGTNSAAKVKAAKNSGSGSPSFSNFAITLILSFSSEYTSIPH